MKTANTLKLSDVVNKYLYCALYTSTQDDELNTPFDEQFRIEDFTTTAKDNAVIDCSSLIDLVSSAGIEYTGTSTQFGYDFWLTRNHHGAGFWDRDDENGDEITAIVHANFRELNLFKTEDGKVCME